MKRNLFTCFLLVGFSLIWFINYSSASWCFGDTVYSVDEAAIVVTSVNMRTVSCMMWSEVIKVVKTNEKVRIIAKDQAWWYKVVSSDGKIWRIAQSFLKITNDRSNLPAYPKNYDAKSLCDTTNPNKCPAWSIGPGVMPKRNYTNPSNNYTKPSYTNTTSTTPSTTSNVKTKKNKYNNKQTRTLDSYKAKLDILLTNFIKKIEEKNSINMQIKKIESIIAAFKIYQNKNPRLSEILWYMIDRLDDELALKQVAWLLDI